MSGMKKKVIGCKRMTSMWLHEHIDRVVKRAQLFYNTAEPGHFLISAHIPAEAPSVPALQDFDLDRQLTEWLDYKLAAAKPSWQVKEWLDDDSIPSICPHFGVAEHSAWLGLDVRLQETTSLPVPRIHCPDDLSQITLSEGNTWFQYMKSSYDYLQTKKDGTFVLSVRGTMAPMDLANALRGDELFTDFLIQPDFCHRLMDWLVPATQWYFGHLLSWADNIAGGHVTYLCSGWMPPNGMGHLSNDTAMLCSPEVYDKFGYPYESRLVEKYDAVFYHVHNEKLHYVPRLATLPHLKLLEVTHDPKTVAPIDDLPRIFKATGSANLLLHATSDQVRVHFEELKHRNVFFLVDCTDRRDAEDIVNFVRDRSQPL
jgi:hypothetical protein